MDTLSSSFFIWVFPKIVVPPNHPFQWVFPYFHHPFWGFSPYFWFNTHFLLAQLAFFVSGREVHIHRCRSARQNRCPASKNFTAKDHCELWVASRNSWIAWGVVVAVGCWLVKRVGWTWFQITPKKKTAKHCGLAILRLWPFLGMGFLDGFFGWPEVKGCWWPPTGRYKGHFESPRRDITHHYVFPRWLVGFWGDFPEMGGSPKGTYQL